MAFTGSDICKVSTRFHFNFSALSPRLFPCLHRWLAVSVCLDLVSRDVVALYPISTVLFLYALCLVSPSLSLPWESSWSAAVEQTSYVPFFFFWFIKCNRAENSHVVLLVH